MERKKPCKPGSGLRGFLFFEAHDAPAQQIMGPPEVTAALPGRTARSDKNLLFQDKRPSMFRESTLYLTASSQANGVQIGSFFAKQK